MGLIHLVSGNTLGGNKRIRGVTQENKVDTLCSYEYSIFARHVWSKGRAHKLYQLLEVVSCIACIVHYCDLLCCMMRTLIDMTGQQHIHGWKTV